MLLDSIDTEKRRPYMAAVIYFRPDLSLVKVEDKRSQVLIEVVQKNRPFFQHLCIESKTSTECLESTEVPISAAGMRSASLREQPFIAIDENSMSVR